MLARGVQPGRLKGDVLSDERTLNCVICVKWHLSSSVSEAAFSMFRPFSNFLISRSIVEPVGWLVLSFSPRPAV